MVQHEKWKPSPEKQQRNATLLGRRAMREQLLNLDPSLLDAERGDAYVRVVAENNPRIRYAVEETSDDYDQYRQRAIEQGRLAAWSFINERSKNAEFTPLVNVEYDFIDDDFFEGDVTEGDLAYKFNNEFLCFLSANPHTDQSDDLLDGYRSNTAWVKKLYDTYPGVYQTLHEHLTTDVPAGRTYKSMSNFYRGVLDHPELQKALLIADREMQRALGNNERDQLDQYDGSARWVITG